MKITKTQLRKLVKEELLREQESLNEFLYPLLRKMAHKSGVSKILPDLDARASVDDNHVVINYTIKLPHGGNKRIAQRIVNGVQDDAVKALKDVLRFMID